MIERTFIKKNFNKMELENYLLKKLDKAGFSKMEIIKTPLVTRIVLYVAKPGLAIGKSGATIKELTETIAKDYEIDNPQLEIQEIKNPSLNARIQAKKMATMIERGFSWRSVSFRTVRDIMSAGAQGVELTFKGKLAGKGGRKRKQRIAIGYMKKKGDQAKYVNYAKAAAAPKAGAIGIKLSIIHPEVIFPDKIEVEKVIENINKVKEEKKEQEKAEAEKVKEENASKETETNTTEQEEKKEEVKTDTENKEEAKKTEKPKTETKVTEQEEEIKKEKHEGIIDRIEHTAEKVVDDVEHAVEAVEHRFEHKEKPKTETKEIPKKEEKKKEVKTKETNKKEEKK